MSKEGSRSANNKSAGWWTMTLLSGLLGLIYLASGGAKLAGLEMVVEQFRGWGYPRWFVDVVGLFEIVGGLLLFVPATRLAGALVLIVIMTGAAGTHIIAEEWVSVATPVVLLAALVWITRRLAWERQRRSLPAGEELRVAS